MFTLLQLQPKRSKSTVTHKIILTIFLILIIAIHVCHVFAFDYVAHKNFVTYSPPSYPAKSGSVTDSDFNTTTVRISDATSESGGSNMATVVYSRWTPLNSSGEYLYFQRTVGNPDAMIYSAIDYSLIKILPEQITIDGVPNCNFNSQESSEIRWDYTGDYPHRFYYANGMRFYQYDLETDTAHLLHDFSNEFPSATSIKNDVEGDSSSDSRYWAWMVKGQYDGQHFPTIAIITYDKETDTILGTMDLSKYQANSGGYGYLPTPNMVEISPTGSKVVTLYGRCWGTEAYGERPLDIGTNFDAPHAWDLYFSNPIKVAADQSHSGWGWDYDGNEMWVSQNNRNDWIEAVNIQTGQTMQLLNHGDLGWGNGMHFSRMPSNVRGWVLMSTYKAGVNTDWGDNQLIMLEIKDVSDSPHVWRLGHTYNNYNEYYAEGFATISQNGDKIWWGAKWPGQNDIEAYEMTLPFQWWNELAGGDEILPGSISNLSASSGTSNGEVDLTWTAPGDDGSTGNASSYLIKYAVTSIANDTQFNTASDVSGEPSPSVAGTSESMTVSGLNPGTTYYFAMKTLDEVPNTSGLSNSTSAAAKETIILPDTMPPYVTGLNPASGATEVVENTNIVIHVKDDGSGVDINTIVMKVNGGIVTPTITGTPADYILTYNPGSEFSNGEVITVSVEASDLAP